LSHIGDKEIMPGLHDKKKTPLEYINGMLYVSSLDWGIFNRDPGKITELVYSIGIDLLEEIDTFL
jgi:hypothetical protein